MGESGSKIKISDKSETENELYPRETIEIPNIVKTTRKHDTSELNGTYFHPS